MCPWLYGHVAFPPQPFRAGPWTVHTQSLHSDGSLEAPSDMAVFPLAKSPGERRGAEALDPHQVGISYPVPRGS